MFAPPRQAKYQNRPEGTVCWKGPAYISKFGLFVALTAAVIFTVITWQIIGAWALIVGPFIASQACLPNPDIEGSPCMWESRDRDYEQEELLRSSITGEEGHY